MRLKEQGVPHKEREQRLGDLTSKGFDFSTWTFLMAHWDNENLHPTRTCHVTIYPNPQVERQRRTCGDCQWPVCFWTEASTLLLVCFPCAPYIWALKFQMLTNVGFPAWKLWCRYLLWPSAPTRKSVCARHILLWGISAKQTGLEPINSWLSHEFGMTMCSKQDCNLCRLSSIHPPNAMQPAQCRFWTEPCNARSLVQAERERKTFWPDVILSWHSRPVVPSYLQALQVPMK